jgi:hypothetical protein
MKFLLTSGGVANASIRNALVELLGKPIEDSGALCIPTVEYGHPRCTPASAWRFIAGRTPAPMCDLGGKSVGVLAGSMVMTPRIGECFMNWRPRTGDDKTLGVVEFSILAHLDHALMPENTMADAEKWAAEIKWMTWTSSTNGARAAEGRDRLPAHRGGLGPASLLRVRSEWHGDQRHRARLIFVPGVKTRQMNCGSPIGPTPQINSSWRPRDVKEVGNG